MTASHASRRRWIALSLVLLTVILAASSSRLRDAVTRLLAPETTPERIIIVAPTDSETV